MTDSPQCDCNGTWPEMERIPAASVDRFYLCRQCGTIRVEHAIHNTANTTGEITFHAVTDPDLPASVREQAAAILGPRDYQQGELL